MNKDLWSLKREFLEYCEIEKGQSLLTISNYERYLNRFLVWLEKNKTVSGNPYKVSGDLNEIPNTSYEIPNTNKVAGDSKEKAKLLPGDISREEIRKYRLHVNRLFDRRGKELKSSTQNHHILALRAFLRYLSMQGVKTVSPDEIALAKVAERKVNFLNAEEYRRLLDAPKKSPRDKAIMELLFSTGMRVSELASLNVGEINFERGEIAVLGKGKKVRVVFVSDVSVESLAMYLQQRGVLQIMNSHCEESTTRQSDIPMSSSGRRSHNPGIQKKIWIPHQVRDDADIRLPRPKGLAMTENKETSNKTEYLMSDTVKKQPLFLSSRGERMNVRAIERLVQKYAKVAGISKNVSPHTLRHTFATDLLIAGADIRSVQSLLGHSNISTTQVYTHVTDQHLRDIHKKYHNIHKEESNHTEDNTE